MLDDIVTSGRGFVHHVLLQVASEEAWFGSHLRMLNDHHPLYDAPSKLARFPALGRAPVLVHVRPANEALLRARVV